ncbi:complement factor H-like isoform X2 [Sceloporus undulatus]|uniref:complement factor H-like isoform X2 n=1 Tax=Sceloporus undulatus TaxID=8520 RepID=UPI001C4DBA3B|nr:complement factor H-like isoform X2 [Sceloporus undulatus]
MACTLLGSIGLLLLYVLCTAQEEAPSGCQNISPPNGFFIERRGQFSLNENVNYRCQSGYTTPNGDQEGETQCLEIGWSPEPKCIKTCQRPSEENIVFDKTQSLFLFKETLHYVCKDGFQTVKETIDSHIQCTENGWDPKPLCLPIECEAPFLEHGSIQPRKDEYVNRDVVKFSCMRGYTRVGPEAAQCYHFGWSPQPPICKEKVNSCQQPPSILNGFVTGDLLQEYQHGEKVVYECDVQFTMAGSNTVECVDGEWISLPSCTEKCKLPKGAKVVPEVPLSKQFNNNAVLKYRCGSSLHETKCVNGKWLPEPECKELCPPPPQLPNAINVAEIRNYKNGEEVDFTCMEHFLLQGPPKISCEYGSWQTPPRCVDATCREAPVVHNAYIVDSTSEVYLSGHELHYQCGEGFEISGPNTIRCENKAWSVAPTCEDVRCPPPPDISNGRINGYKKQKYLPNEKVRYHCLPGYSLFGSPVITCLRKQWTEAPQCREKPCGKPPIIDHASYLEQVKNKYDPGEVVNYKCHSGFAPEGPLTLTCQRGEWSEPSTCEDATCSDPPVVENADIVEGRAEAYPLGHKLHYQCHEGFEISGPNPVRCENKVWSESPTCEDVRCPSPPDISNGRINGQKKQRYLPGEKVHYRCLPRYSLFGSPVITCSEKQWTEAPQCREAQGKCDRPPTIENGDIIEIPKREYNSGERVQYKCQRYYRMEGNPEVSCLNGHWSEAPRCIGMRIIS